MAQKHTSTLGYFIVWIALIALTLASFLISRAHLGAMDTVIALGIAVVKSTLVGLFFMHILEERFRTAFVPIITVVYILILMSFVVTDIVSRRTFPRTPLPMEIPEEIRPPEEGPGRKH